MSVLQEILSHKREELARALCRVAPEEMARRAAAAASPRGFRRALEGGSGVRVIAELKRRSPSRGMIRADFDPGAIARGYAAGGAAALSVLTDERFFGGSLEVFEAVRKATELPLLRKDFVVDPYQVDEARAAGADAILLIVAALESEALEALHARARGLGMDVLVEVHDRVELERAAALGADLVGINNRDLRSFETDLATTERLAPLAPPGALVVAESGIFEPSDVHRLERVGARAFLVGESLMGQEDVALALRRLRGEA